jgi:hypothetical protein
MAKQTAAKQLDTPDDIYTIDPENESLAGSPDRGKRYGQVRIYLDLKTGKLYALRNHPMGGWTPYEVSPCGDGKGRFRFSRTIVVPQEIKVMARVRLKPPTKVKPPTKR